MKSAIGFAAAVSAVVLATAGCAAGATTNPSTMPTATASSVRTLSASPSQGSPRLIVLADGVNGGNGIWSLDTNGKWVALAATPGATAVGETAGGIAIATGHDIDERPISDLAHAGTIRSLKWSAAAPVAPVVAIDGSPSGELAIATADEHSLAYGIAAADGTVTALAPAPTQSFTPLVAWLDETSLLVLTMDKLQVSRLAVVKLGDATLEPFASVVGATTFAVSANHQAAAVATENSVYAGPIGTFLSGSQPDQVAAISGSQVVWAIAMNAAGTQVFILSGTEAADGTVGSFHEIGYTKQGSAWAKTFDVAAPFSKAIGQVSLT
jgi:hypothetical protein